MAFLFDKITISDLSGKEIICDRANNAEINISALQKGIYLLQVFSEGEIFTDKIIKQ